MILAIVIGFAAATAVGLVGVVIDPYGEHGLVVLAGFTMIVVAAGTAALTERKLAARDAAAKITQQRAVEAAVAAELERRGA